MKCTHYKKKKTRYESMYENTELVNQIKEEYFREITENCGKKKQ